MTASAGPPSFSEINATDGRGRLDEPRIALVLIAGLPGCGKTSFCQTLLPRLRELPNPSCTISRGAPLLCHHVCYDKIEAELRGSQCDFDPAIWKAARDRATEVVTNLLPSESRRESQSGSAEFSQFIILLDDNMYYRSMRKKWYQFAKQHHCVYRQILLTAPTDVCLARNSSRGASSQVPDFSIKHMAEVFEWPPEDSITWESQEPITTIIDTCEASTEAQVDTFINRFCGTGANEFWSPLPLGDLLEPPGPDVQSCAHVCDLALRRIVSQALACVPKERGDVKSLLAKRWGAQKTDLVKQLTLDMKSGEHASPVEDVIHDMEGVFLKSCIADILQQNV